MGNGRKAVPILKRRNTMEPHQERVVVEKSELNDKITKLSVFLNGSTFHKLPPDEQLRMTAQLDAMQRYSNILGERIAAFKPSKE